MLFVLCKMAQNPMLSDRNDTGFFNSKFIIYNVYTHLATLTHPNKILK